MKYGSLLLIAVGGARLCFATTLPPNFHQLALLDRVFEIANSESPTRSTALEILERVAGGTMDSASAELETQVGLNLEPGKMHGPTFKDPDIRIYALRKIGEVSLPEALAYLRGLKTDDFGQDGSGRVWPAVQIAVHQALLTRISGEPAKIEFLENTLKGAAGFWAVEELCNRGSYVSLPLIRDLIWKVHPTPRGEEDIRFCQARMEILSRNPDRVKALGAFLSVGQGSSDRRLISWAINQLYLIKTPLADAELERYMNEIGKLPKHSPQREVLRLSEEEIRGMLDRRRAGSLK